MDMTIEDVLKIMKQFFEETDKELISLNKDLEIEEQEQQDLLHYIENNNLNAGKYAKVGKKIKEIRKNRRIIKNNIERIKLVKTFTDKYNKKLIIGDIVQILKGLNTITKKQQNPIYIRRTEIIRDMDMEIKDDNKNSTYVQKQEE